MSRWGVSRTSERTITVHHRGDRGVDGILHLIELASHDGPLEMMLTAMCGEVAAITGVDIASIYVREGDDEGMLVMRGNHGFAATAIGTTLAVGEGITGLVAECMRPVSAAHAATEASYKPVPGLGEEQFPVFVGIPLISGGATIGVLVMQRRKKPFATDEVTLAAALGAPVTLAIERRRASALRSARLTGQAHVGGVVLGRAGVVPTSTAIAIAPTDIERAVVRLRDYLGNAVRRLADAEDSRIGAALDRFALTLVDQRLRERLIEAAGQPSGLRTVAKEYARVKYRLGTSNDEEHVSEIEELCALLGLAADPRASAKPGAVWLADRIGGFVAIAAVGRGAGALVASDSATPAAVAIAGAARLPLVSGVAGLFGWVRAGDLLAVDGSTGTVLVHPAPSEIERLRHEQK
ncbi:MAG: Phosphocarrier protein kinase/phosphorylase [Myxococcales bacterium]|nr:Phosphocarrier protein kinase/phosphorylase [Myxococcales bacterium]